MQDNEINKIPKIIHYVWFGPKAEDNLTRTCIENWKKYLPDYKIIRWNENNFDINSHYYTKMAAENKKWAFVSDYARLRILYDQGGIYLDTDMYVLKNFEDLLNYDIFLGYEDNEFINSAVLGSKKNNWLIKKVLEEYDLLKELETIPKIITRVLAKENIENKNIKIFEPVYFYPFSIENIKAFNYKNAPKESYAVHLWNYSWGHPFNKFIKKIGLHKHLKYVAEKTGIKNILKKILKME